MATVSQVGSYFVGKYYQDLLLQPHVVHLNYKDVSSMVRVAGNSTLTADTIWDIHRIVMSLDFKAAEILTVNSLQSWGGGVLVMVSGNVIVRVTGYDERRKFVQSFFLAPDGKGFFILNDIFQFLEERSVIQDHAAPQLSENKLESRLRVSNSQVSGYLLKKEAIENMPSTSSQHLGYDPEEDGGFKKLQQKYPEQSTIYQQIFSLLEDDGSEEQQQRYPEKQSVTNGTPEKSSTNEHPLYPEKQSVTNGTPEQSSTNEHPRYPEKQSVTDGTPEQSSTNEHPLYPEKQFVTNGTPEQSSTNEHPRYPEKQSVTNGTPEQSSTNEHPRFLQNGQTKDVNRDVHEEEPHKETYATLLQAPKRIPAASTSSQPVANPRVPAKTKEQAVDSSDEYKSVFLNDLPTCASTAIIEEKFKKFGKIQHDGIFMSRVQSSGTCFGIVDYENTSSVENALKRSPIELEGRRIYIQRTTGTARDAIRFYYGR